MMLYGITKFLSKYMPWMRLKNYFIRKINETWEFSSFFEMIGTSYIYVLVGVLLQFYDFDGSDSSSYINYMLFSFSSVFVTYYPLYLFRLIK